MAIGNKGLGFLNRIGAQVLSHAVHLGDAPQLDKLIGPVKVLLDAYAKGELKSVHLSYTRFINTMKQEVVMEQLLPLSAVQMQAETRARETAAFVTGLLDGAAKEIDRGRNPEALQRALDRSARPLQELAYDPELQSMLLQRVSDLYSTMGDWKTSLNLMETRAAVLARVQGPASAEAMEAELKYLKLLADQGSRTAAPPRLETLLKRVESVGRQGSPFWFEVQRERVRVLLKLDAGRKALALSKETMAMADLFKPKESDLLRLQLSHSAALEEVGDYPAAEQTLMQCRHASNGRIQASVFNQLIHLLKRQGDPARAAGLLRERIASSQKLEPRENTDPVRLLIPLSKCESDAGQHDSAIGHAREALDLVLARGAPGEGNPDRSDAGDCLRALAMAESAAGRHGEAIGHAREARRHAGADARTHAHHHAARPAAIATAAAVATTAVHRVAASAANTALAAVGA